MSRWGRLAWFDMGDEGARAAARKVARSRPGVYLLRRKGSRRIEYIGSSDPGVIQRRRKPDPNRLWKTVNRHFQSCRSRGAYSFGSDNFCTGDRGRFECAILLTRTGEQARAVEEEAIRHFKPTYNEKETAAYGEVDVERDDGIPF